MVVFPLGNWAYFILTQLPAREDDRPGGGPRYTLPRYSPYLMATQVLDWGREHDPQGRPGPELETKRRARNDFFLGVDGKDLGPVDLHSKFSRPLDPPDPIESASRMHFAGKPLEKVCRFSYDRQV